MRDEETNGRVELYMKSTGRFYVHLHDFEKAMHAWETRHEQPNVMTEYEGFYGDTLYVDMSQVDAIAVVPDAAADAINQAHRHDDLTG